MGKLLDLTGQRFGFLLVTDCAGRDPWGQALWNCLCDCGQTHVAKGAKLRTAEVRSCGCKTSDLKRVKLTRHGHSPWNGLRSHEYSCWTAMKSRCRHTRRRDYKHYGGRGIRVCERWQVFENFLADMGRSPSPGHTVDRIDSNGNYEPSNCRWATQREQCNNKRDTIWLTYKGERATLLQWAERTGIGWHAMYQRRRRGWSVDKMIETPLIKSAIRSKAA
jgi:hypothetical protein